MNHLIGIAVAASVMFAAYQFVKATGVRQEVVRVEAQGKKANAQAQIKRKAVEAKKPDELRADLRKYCSDCDAK